MAKTRRNKTRTGGDHMTIPRFIKVVDAVTERLADAEDEGKKNILRVFAGLSAEDKAEVNREFMPINASLDISKHRAMGSKLYSFAKMH
jgi:hypothetical protein